MQLSGTERAFPVYLTLLEQGLLAKRVVEAEQVLQQCRLCGNECEVDRLDQPGPCRVGDVAYVASYGSHMGEEDVLRGRRGSGTIFFSGCNLHCVYCQNYDISQSRAGYPVSAQELASIMLELEGAGCHNINLVSPSHVVPQIVAGLAVAIQAGLRLPIVYNTGGYDSPLALHLMEGFVDIYMPDMKYADPEVAQRLSCVPDYPAVNRAAVREMHRQVGDLVVDDQGVAKRGLLVRHLVLPNGLAGTGEIARFLVEEISSETYINIMGQYRPAYRAGGFPEIDRPPTQEEIREAFEAAREAGLQRFDERRSWWR
ncbi:MAG: radical SAM protein [Anaerolineales bacterium]